VKQKTTGKNFEDISKTQATYSEVGKDNPEVVGKRSGGKSVKLQTVALATTISLPRRGGVLGG